MAINSSAKGEDLNQEFVKYILDCKQEAEDAKYDRMQLNQDNFAIYQLKHDFSHKIAGQSTEVLPKVRMSVEQTKSFFQQAVADLLDWYNIEVKDASVPEDALLVKPHEAMKLLTFMHRRCRYYAHIGNSVQSGLLGALIINKNMGHEVFTPKFTVKKSGRGKSFRKNVEMIEDGSWELRPKLVRQEDYYPDPTGFDLYEIEYMELDLHMVKAKSKGDDAIYDSEMVDQLSKSVGEDLLRQQDMYRETGQNTTVNGHRPKVRLLEFWGDIVDNQGDITHRNVVMTLANEKWLIRKPEPNPLWHQESPYTTAPLMEVANSVWPIALMDAPTKLNRTIIELHNLILDAAFKRVHTIDQIRVNDLVDPSQVTDGIEQGTKLLVKSSLPHGAKVMEPLDQSDVPNDAVNILALHNQEYNASAVTSDLRQGLIAPRAVKATEVVEQSQTITSVFQGVTKNLEANYLEPDLEKQWMTVAQNWDKISKDIFVSLFGIQRGTELSQLDPEDVFVSSVNGYKYSVFGISSTLSKAQDYRKHTTLLQTISNSDILIEEFVRRFDFGKLLGEIMSSLDIDKHKIAIDQPQEQVGAQGGAAGPGTGPNNDQASTPSAAAPSILDALGGSGAIPPQTGSFPATQF